MFDGAFNTLGHGVRVVLISQKNQFIPFTTRLCFDFTNNIMEYKACIMGIEIGID